MAAVTLTEAGKPDVFTNLYPTDCSKNSTFSGFLSTNIINGIYCFWFFRSFFKC